MVRRSSAVRPSFLASLDRILFPSVTLILKLLGGNLRHLDRGADYIARPFLSGRSFGHRGFLADYIPTHKPAYSKPANPAYTKIPVVNNS